MINDRGTQKWTSIMLPEHIEALKQLRKEQDYKRKPILDEQLIEENGIKLQMAIEDNSTVEIKYFKNHDFHFIDGKLRNLNKDELVFENEERSRIKFSDVINVDIK